MPKNLLILVIMIIMGCETNKFKDHLVIAHRGVPYFAPEETTPAFILARDLGADYLEADLQRTKDGVIIAVHDNTLVRTTNVAEIFPERANDPVSHFTWEELQQLDAGSWFNEKYPDLARASYSGLKILSLEQLIEIAVSGEDQPGLYLETKIPRQFPGIEKDLQELLKAKGWLDKTLANGRPAIILQSFVPQSITLLRQEFPETPITYLLWQGEGCLSDFTAENLENCLEFARIMNVDVLGVSFSGERTGYFNQLEPWFISTVEDNGMQLHAYTFDTDNDISRFAPSVDGQFTNRTDLSLEYVRREHPDVEAILTKYGY